MVSSDLVYNPQLINKSRSNLKCGNGRKNRMMRIIGKRGKPGKEIT
jgi:hypothetical protein